MFRAGGNGRVLRRRRVRIRAWCAVLVSAVSLVAILGGIDLRVVIAAAALGGGVIDALLRTGEVDAERDEELGSLVRIPIQPVRDLDAHDVGVAPEAPEALAGLGRSDGDQYAFRDVDDQLDAELRDALEARDAGFVVLSGPSKAGKTRTLFEAMCRVMPDALLVAPRSFESIDELVRPGVLPTDKEQPVVLWLDDLEQFVRVGARGMSNAVLRELKKWDGQVLVLATSGGKGLRIAGDATRFSGPMEDLMSHARQFRLRSEPSQRELECLEGYAPEAAERIATEGIGGYMITGQQLEEKLLDGRYPYGAPKSPHGQAVTYTVIDWHRCGIVDPIPRAVLRDVYEDYLPESLDPSDAGFSEGLQWAREPLYSTVALISGRDEFKAYDYIVSFVERSQGKEISMQTWRRFLRGATEEQAFDLAIAADGRGEAEPAVEWTTLAEQAVRLAAASGDHELAAASEFRLSLLLADRGEEEEAREAVRRAERAGLENAPVQLAHYLSGQGEEPQAEAVLRDADQAGNPVASLSLGVMLHGRDEREAALEAFQRAERERPAQAGGWVNLLPYVKLLAHEERSRRKAEAAFRWAQKGGCALAGIALGHLRDQSGDQEGSIDALRVSAEAGDFLAAMKLGGMLESIGRESEAQWAFRRAREIREAQMREEGDASP
jgi:hypothetical protein